MKIKTTQLEQLIKEEVKAQGGNVKTQQRIVENIKRRLNENQQVAQQFEDFIDNTLMPFFDNSGLWDYIDNTRIVTNFTNQIRAEIYSHL